MLGAGGAVTWRGKKLAGGVKPEMAVWVREEVEEEEGRGHLLDWSRRKYSRLLPGDRLARRWTRLRNKYATGSVTAIRHSKNKRPIP